MKHCGSELLYFVARRESPSKLILCDDIVADCSADERNSAAELVIPTTFEQDCRQPRSLRTLKPLGVVVAQNTMLSAAESPAPARTYH